MFLHGTGRWLAWKTDWRKRGGHVQNEGYLVCEWFRSAIRFSGFHTSYCVLVESGAYPCLFFRTEFPLILFILPCVLKFQGVHSMLDGCPGKTWSPDEQRINKLVFIGRNLDETALRKGFKGCLVWLKKQILVKCPKLYTQRNKTNLVSDNIQPFTVL